MYGEMRVADIDFYAALGLAVANWQEVESSLSYLLRSAIRHPDYAHVAEVFYSVQNFRDKLRMVDAAVRYAMKKSPEFLTNWERTRRKIHNRSQRRNEIAHGYVWHFSHKGGPDAAYLGESHSLPSKVRETLEGGIGLLKDKRKLRATAASFDLLATRISHCRQELDARLVQLVEVP